LHKLRLLFGEHFPASLQPQIRERVQDLSSEEE
jgi:hypothetical protein